MARSGRRRNWARTRNDYWWALPSRLHELRRATLPARIADQIRRKILLGELKPGIRLESCRAMAREAQVGIGVVREAIAELRAERLVRVRHGVGVFVVAPQRKARIVRAARRTASRRETLEMRAALEPVVAEAASRRSTRTARMELRLMLGERERMRRTGHADAFATADLAFHRTLFKMSGNRLAAGAAELAARDLVRSVRAHAEAIAADDDLQRLHARLTDAIDERRPGMARRAARAIVMREGDGERASQGP
jgi:GntR family transcriptional regulator, transcriptional repressor for pyruvate dehydrogenase complex